VVRQLIDLAGVTVCFTVLRLHIILLVCGLVTSRVSLKIVVHRAHQVLVPQVLGVRVLQVVVPLLDLLLDLVYGVRLVVWVLRVLGCAHCAQWLGQGVALEHVRAGYEPFEVVASH